MGRRFLFILTPHPIEPRSLLYIEAVLKGQNLEKVEVQSLKSSVSRGLYTLLNYILDRICEELIQMFQNSTLERVELSSNSYL